MTAAELEERRQAAIRLSQNGKTQSEVAVELGVHLRSVQKWIATYRRNGRKGLAAKSRPGRRRRLTDQDLARLESALLQGAEHFGYQGNLWTSQRVADIVWKVFGVKFHINYFPTILKQLGWSVQRPTRRATERDEEAIERWAKRDWPKIKKKPRKRVQP
jgi:transposase